MAGKLTKAETRRLYVEIIIAVILGGVVGLLGEKMILAAQIVVALVIPVVVLLSQKRRMMIWRVIPLLGFMAACLSTQ